MTPKIQKAYEALHIASANYWEDYYVNHDPESTTTAKLHSKLKFSARDEATANLIEYAWSVLDKVEGMV